MNIPVSPGAMSKKYNYIPGAFGSRMHIVIVKSSLAISSSSFDFPTPEDWTSANARAYKLATLQFRSTWSRNAATTFLSIYDDCQDFNVAEIFVSYSDLII